MSISAIVRALVDAGATPQMILAAVEAAEKDTADKLAHRRASDAARQAAMRERTKRDHVTSRDVTTAVPSHAGARTETPTTNSFSPPQENKKQDSSLRSQREKQPRAHLMPEGFEPKPETFAKAEAKGHSRQAVLEKAEGLFAWSRTKNEKRADWDLMILMGLGRDARASKPSTGPPRRGRSFLEIAEAADAYLRENHEPPDDELSSRPN